MLTVAACGKYERPDDGSVRFSASVRSAAKTRVADTIWNANSDKVGVFMVEHEGANIIGGVSNYEYTAINSTGTLWGTDRIFYPQDGTAVDFVAYYPYQLGTTMTSQMDVMVGGAQTTYTQSTYDYMWVRGDNDSEGYTRASPRSVPLRFSHRLSKVVFNCVRGEGITEQDIEGMTLTISGMYTTAKFMINTGGLTTPNTKGNIVARQLAEPNVKKAAVSFDAIVIPADYSPGDNVLATFNLASGDALSWKITNQTNSFAIGGEYIYTITVNRTGVDVAGSIGDWTNHNNGTTTAE